MARGLWVAWVSCPDSKTALKIARTLVDERLAACVQIIPQVLSVYSWKGRRAEDREKLLLIKTRGHVFKRMTQRIIALHPYECPEITGCAAGGASASYARWVESVVVKSRSV